MSELKDQGVLDSDEAADLIRLLNRERKAYAYDGDEPDFGGEEVESVIAQVEDLVIRAEEAQGDG